MGEHKYNLVAIEGNVKYDAVTSRWFGEHLGDETTVTCCPNCGLYYKPNLGHVCKINKKGW